MLNLYVNSTGSITENEIQKKSKDEIKKSLNSICSNICFNWSFDYESLTNAQVSNFVSLLKLYCKDDYGGAIYEEDFIQNFMLKSLTKKFYDSVLKHKFSEYHNTFYSYCRILGKLSPFNPYIHNTQYWYDIMRKFIQEYVRNDEQVINCLDTFYKENVLPFNKEDKETRLYPYSYNKASFGTNISSNWVGQLTWIDDKNNHICLCSEPNTTGVEWKEIPPYEAIYKVGDYTPCRSVSGER